MAKKGGLNLGGGRICLDVKTGFLPAKSPKKMN